MTRLLNALVACFVLTAAPCWAATFTVASTDAAWSAVKAAHAGDVVQLQAGSYGALTMAGDAKTGAFTFSGAGVTVQPAPGAKVALSGIVVNGASGLTFSGFDVQMPADGYGVYAYGASNVTFDKLTVSMADGSFKGVGAFIRSSSDVAITNSEFHHVGVGISNMDVVRPRVAANRIHDIGTDGIDLAGTPGAVVDGNRITGLFPEAGAHPDAIQAWATAANPNPDGVQITNNVYTRGLGTAAQGIFIENLKNVAIQGNAVSCTMANGISVSATTGALIAGNFAQGCDDYGSRIIARGGVTGSSDVAIRGNTISQAVVNLVQAGDKPVINFASSDNTLIAIVKTPPAGIAPDTSALDKWVAAKGGPAAPPPVVVPPVVTPPVVTPPASPVVDARDAQIVTLTAQNATLAGQVAALTQAANDNAARLATAQGATQTATTQLANLTAQVKALQAQAATNAAALKATNDNSAVLAKKISAAQAALK